MTNLIKKLDYFSYNESEGEGEQTQIIIDNNHNNDNNNNDEDIEIRNMLATLNDIEEMQRNLLLLTIEQDKMLDNIDNNMEDINYTLDNAFDDLEKASQLQFRYLPVLMGCSIGLATFGPLSLIPSLKIGGIITGIGAGGIGGYFGYKIQ